MILPRLTRPITVLVAEDEPAIRLLAADTLMEEGFTVLEAADARGVPLSKDDSRTHVYGMPYEEWRAKHQTEASPAQLAGFEKNKPAH